MSGDALDIDARIAGILPKLRRQAETVSPRVVKGRILRAVGVTIHASVAQVRLGEVCRLRDPVSGVAVLAEVVGLLEDAAVLTPLGDLSGLSSATEVIPTGSELRVPVGPGLLGRVLSALGEPLDGGAWPPPGMVGTYPLQAPPPPPMARDIIKEPLQLGIRSLDGLVTCARGQRIGIFGEPGVGKSTLLAQIVKGTEADVVVIGLIGERGREVREFLERELGEEGRRRSVTVVATSDRPAIERVKAAYVATAIAEYFRDQGRSVLLLMDSVTRFARAQREIGLAAGEPPTRRGFPSSLFAVLPQLLERSGPGQGGAITGLYTVLMEGDGTQDPIAEEVRSILDGHVVLSAELAHRNHFPAIDVLKSRSRLMDAVVTPEHSRLAGRVRDLMARYAEVELLVRVGEYQRGSDSRADEAIDGIDAINDLLRQGQAERSTMAEVQQRMRMLVS
ncbi:EscN/YscN/HrcN family type III secretion system ATPase [Chelatococcus daeguensis]|uniref:Type 3 secretion system ATPase n=1 Tax=Chelatococcus daeguensis TaxID=444444 RepID=A0AAC9JU52_9HYPH|nr:type III secretion system ATPase SctN [Chelatococcus daeguensis]APF38711.1 EscN/YscN/HrcN family type III secretion system ATPase [Chelatococcus daeguensis]